MYNGNNGSNNNNFNRNSNKNNNCLVLHKSFKDRYEPRKVGTRCICRHCGPSNPRPSGRDSVLSPQYTQRHLQSQGVYKLKYRFYNATISETVIFLHFLLCFPLIVLISILIVVYTVGSLIIVPVPLLKQ